MLKPFQIRVAVVLLAGFTLAAAILAIPEFRQRGLIFAAHGSGFMGGSPGRTEGAAGAQGWSGRAGRNQGRRSADGGQQRRPTPRMASLTRQWFATGVYRRVDYLPGPLRRPHPRIGHSGARRPQPHQGLRLIALVYLSIGLYVLFRRWTAPRATHFYVFCLASFVLYSFNYTGKFNTFDWTIYWGKIFAQALQPALFLHFALAFPEERPASRRTGSYSLIYLPGLAIIALQVVAMMRWSATELLNTRLDQLAMGYLAALLCAGGAGFLPQLSAPGEPAAAAAVEVADAGELCSPSFP